MNRLRELREERNYEAQKVAQDMNIQEEILVEYENGSRIIDQITLYNFTVYYQVNADYILEYDHDYVYAEIENMDMTINFTHDEYVSLDKEKIYFLGNKRYIDINDIFALMKYQDYVKNDSVNIKSIDWKYINSL